MYKFKREKITGEHVFFKNVDNNNNSQQIQLLQQQNQLLQQQNTLLQQQNRLFHQQLSTSSYPNKQQEQQQQRKHRSATDVFTHSAMCNIM